MRLTKKRYPAGHVYIYSMLYKLTDSGENIFRAQLIFVGLYMATLALVFRSYVKAQVTSFTHFWFLDMLR